jgi:hypothetical protein
MSLLTLQNVEIPTDHRRSDHQPLKINWENFELEYGFWHPFGPHGRESPADIIHRKRRETEHNGWTLWSFQYRTPETIAAWYQELSSARAPVVVFCSKGRRAVDPDRHGGSVKTVDCRQYRLVGDREFRPVPDLIRVPHPFKANNSAATAFVVQRVYYQIQFFRRPKVEWFSQKQGGWSQDKLPTRPEYLVRTGGEIAMPDVSAILELKPPYLAILKR